MKFSRLALGLVLSVTALGCQATPYGIDGSAASRARVGVATTTSANVPSETGLQDRMREVFIDRAAWTRLYAIAIASNAPDANVTRARLMRSQREVGDVIARFYGRAAGDELTRLLDDGVDWEAQAAHAAAQGNETGVERARRGWFVNASRVSTFLASIDPAFSQRGLSIALRTSAADAVDSIDARTSGRDRATEDDAEASVGQSLALADILAGGIAQQFPRKVAGPALDARAQSVRVVLRDAFTVRGVLLHEYVVEASLGGPGREAAKRRLVASASAIERPLGFFYGGALAGQLGELLRTETRDATRTVDAVLAGDEAAIDTARNDWGVDADRFAWMLSRANPRLDRNLVDRAMRDAIAASISDARHRRNGEWVAAVDSADVVRGRMARVGDAISGPVISQFEL